MGVMDFFQRASDSGIPMSVFALPEPHVSRSEPCGTLERVRVSLAGVRSCIPLFPEIETLPEPMLYRVTNKEASLFGEKGPILTMEFYPDPGIRETEQKEILDEIGADSSGLSYKNETGCTGTFSLKYAVPEGKNAGYRLDGAIYGTGENATVCFYPPAQATGCQRQEEANSKILIALQAMQGAFSGMPGPGEKPAEPSP